MDDILEMVADIPEDPTPALTEPAHREPLQRLPEGEIRVDLSSWTTMHPLQKWEQATRLGRIDVLNDLMAGVVKAWPFEADPGLPSSYLNLSMKDWGSVQKAVRDSVSRFFSDAIR